MAVHTLKHNPLSIQRHNVVFHLKPSDTDSLRNHFYQAALYIQYFDSQIIEIRGLCTPQQGIFYWQDIAAFFF